MYRWETRPTHAGEKPAPQKTVFQDSSLYPKLPATPGSLVTGSTIAKTAPSRPPGKISTATRQSPDGKTHEHGEILEFKQWPGVKFFCHRADRKDDLVELAIKCGTTDSEIRRYNPSVVFDHLDNVHGDILYIPLGVGFSDVGMLTTDEHNSANEEYFATKNFMEMCPKATPTEAQFYLTDAKWNVPEAVRQWQDDIAWENEQKKAQQLQKAYFPAASKVPALPTDTSTSSSTSILPTVAALPARVFPAPSAPPAEDIALSDIGPLDGSSSSVHRRKYYKFAAERAEGEEEGVALLPASKTS